MPKQATVMMGRQRRGGASSRGRGRGRGRSGSASRRTEVSSTPVAQLSGPKLTLKLNMGINRGQESAAQPSIVAFDEPEEQQAEEEDEDELPVAESMGGARRSGRERKPMRDAAFAYGNDMDDQIPSSAPKADDEDEYKSSPPPRAPTILTRQPQSKPEAPRKPSRPRKSTFFQPSLEPVYEHFATSDTLANSSPPTNYALSIDTIDPIVHQTFKFLSNSTKIHIDLPELVDDLGAEKPYTAQDLVHLYILAYRASNWSICDLICDTWIRAFHALRRRDSKRATKKDATWRPNPSSHMKTHKGFDPRVPNYGSSLPTDDPLLDPSVTFFSPSLLSSLYTATRTDTGARLLWADALALCGSRLESTVKKTRTQWPGELVFDVMCTSLRMTRRKLTLKIEESAEGVWCKRYHEHTRRGLPCYRKLAYERKIRGDETSDEDEEVEGDNMAEIMAEGLQKDDEDAGDDFAKLMAEELERSEKRDLDDDTKEMGEAKRMRIGDVDREVLDEDAEGETDDE